MSNNCSLSANIGPVSGNNISKSHRKTRRRFLPNLQNVSLDSSLGKKKLKIATSTIRTISKHGGLDSYLLGVKAKRLTPLAKKMRRNLQKKIDKGLMPAFVPIRQKRSKPVAESKTQAD